MYLDEIISKSGVKPDSVKVLAIRRMAIPQNKNEKLRFMGILNYLSKYIAKVTDKTVHEIPVTKISKWQWTEKQGHEFNLLKDILCSTPTLQCFDIQ